MVIPKDAEDPYSIMGLKASASLDEIKHRYRLLARHHHPDKLGHLEEEERREHEAYFKKVTVAYRFLIDGGGVRTDFDEDGYNPKSWYEIWSKLEERMNSADIMSTMTSFFKSSIFDAAVKYSQMKKAAAASEGMKTESEAAGGHVHRVKLQVTLEEIHMSKKRKVRLFLKHEPQPIFVTVDCGKYPKFTCICNTEDDRELYVEVQLLCALHPIFTLMDMDGVEDGVEEAGGAGGAGTGLVDGLWTPFELFCEVKIDLEEYFLGCTKRIRYLDGSEMDIGIPCMPDLYVPMRIVGKGLQGKADLLVSVRLEPRQKINLENLPLDKKVWFLETISGAAGA